MTVRTVELATELRLAEIFVLPTATPVARPSVLDAEPVAMVATAVDADFQETDAVRSLVELSL